MTDTKGEEDHLTAGCVPRPSRELKLLLTHYVLQVLGSRQIYRKGRTVDIRERPGRTSAANQEAAGSLSMLLALL